MPLALILAMLFGCTPDTPPEALSWQERWELLALTNDDRILDVQWMAGNTGVLRGQGRLHLDLWTDAQPPIRFARHSPPDAVDIPPERDAITLSQDALLRVGEGWVGRVDEPNEIAGQFRLTPTARGQRRVETWAVGHRQWSVEALSTEVQVTGGVRSGPRGGLFSGRGVLLHTGGDARVGISRSVMVTFHPKLSMGIIQEGEGQLAWAVSGDTALPLDEVRATFATDGAVEVQGPSLSISLSPDGVKGVTDPLGHLLAVEAMLAGRPMRTVFRATGRATVGADSFPIEAVVLRVASGGEVDLP
ncbi:MAG: hypothetical protein AAFV53_04140 [Myxococcota bacterium]